MAYLDIQAITKRFGQTTALAGVSFEAEKGEVIALLGPSGCGKTTLLNLIAGFFSADSGRISVDGRDLAQVPPHRRGMAMVFQNYALFPHLTVAQNVAFGLEAHGVPRDERAPRIDAALDSVRLRGLEARYPSALSGGQQQRIALARALVLRPSLLLLDEPLSNLDTLLRKAMREEVREILKGAGITTVLVTHDQEEALVVADRILLMSAGRIEQSGAPQDIYERPRTLFGARFMETTNFIPGEIVGRDGGGLTVRTQIGALRAAQGDAPIGAQVMVTMRPERIRIAVPSDHSHTDNTVAGTVRRATYLGTMVRLHVAVGDVALIAHVPVSSALAEGQPVRVAWATADTLVLRDTAEAASETKR